MRIGTFNLNNLFERPKLFEFPGFSNKAQKVLDDISRLNALLEYDDYSQVSNELTKLLSKYFSKGSGTEYFEINQIRGKLFSVNKDGSGVKLKAKGRNDWFGWVELIKTSVNGEAIQNTGKVIKTISPEIMCVVEADNRIALENFNNQILDKYFKYNMLIDGNDDRGIDVGIYSNYEISSIESHVFDYYESNGRKFRIFSRDCAEFEIKFNNKRLYMLCNHFKSKGYGSQESNNRKREIQAKRVNEILQKYNLEKDYVVVAGDLNDTPDSEPLQPLLSNTKLVNTVEQVNGSKGTYLNKEEQIDYLLVSNALHKKLQTVEIERRGIYKNGKVKPFETVTSAVNQASDHAAVWADFDI